MNIIHNWDTAMVLTAILAPLCLLFLSRIFKQWQRINELKHDLKAVSAETAKLQAAVQNRDEEINRQKKTLNALHNGEIAKLNQNHTQEIHRLIELYSSGMEILPPKSILKEQERKQQGE
jgi:thiamine biosynthesis lipoprotein ApbE